MLLKMAIMAIALKRYVAAALPMPLIPCAKAKLRLYWPSSLTSRMMGLPATCRKVVPMPNRKIQPKRTGKLGIIIDGITSEAALSPKPRSNRFFLPMRAASKPPGTLKTAKAMKTTNGNNVDITLLML